MADSSNYYGAGTGQGSSGIRQRSTGSFSTGVPSGSTARYRSSSTATVHAPTPTPPFAVSPAFHTTPEGVPQTLPTPAITGWPQNGSSKTFADSMVPSGRAGEGSNFEAGLYQAPSGSMFAPPVFLESPPFQADAVGASPLHLSLPPDGSNQYASDTFLGSLTEGDGYGVVENSNAGPSRSSLSGETSTSTSASASASDTNPDTADNTEGEQTGDDENEQTTRSLRRSGWQSMSASVTPSEVDSDRETQPPAYSDYENNAQINGSGMSTGILRNANATEGMQRRFLAPQSAYVQGVNPTPAPLIGAIPSPSPSKTGPSLSVDVPSILSGSSSKPSRWADGFLSDVLHAVPGYDSVYRKLFPNRRRKKRNPRSFSFSLSPIPFNSAEPITTKSYPHPHGLTGSGRRKPSFSHRRAPSNRPVVNMVVPIICYAVLFFIVAFKILPAIVESRYVFHVNLEVYNKPAVEFARMPEKPPPATLAGCFNPDRMAKTSYNASVYLNGPRYLQLASGKGMKAGMECYDFSATIPRQHPNSELQSELLNYHTYWRADLMPFSTRQAATLKSFLATQPLANSRLILWSNAIDDIRKSPYLAPLLERYPKNIVLAQIDIAAMAKGTPLESSAKLELIWDKKAWVDGDAIRLLALWNHGGIWFDMDNILTRDIHPLTEQEFVTQWDCYDRPDLGLNGAIMHFRQHSPYLCEAFHIMANSPQPKPNSITWGAKLYQTLHRNLVAAQIKPFTVLPWCFIDPRNCRPGNSFPDPFLPDPKHWEGVSWTASQSGLRSGKSLFEERLRQIWSVHLHNQYDRQFPANGWVERLLAEHELRLAMLPN